MTTITLTFPDSAIDAIARREGGRPTDEDLRDYCAGFFVAMFFHHHDYEAARAFAAANEHPRTVSDAVQRATLAMRQAVAADLYARR